MRPVFSFAFPLLLMYAAGCRFEVQGNDASSGTPPAPDLAARADSALDAGAHGFVDAAGSSTTTDASSPTCTLVSETFGASASTRWTLAGNAYLDPTSNELVLTTLHTNVAGSAFYDVPIYTQAFDATFTIGLLGGSGADGLALVFAKGTSAAGLGAYGNGVANTAWGLGYLGMDGWAVEFDTYKDSNNGDPDNNHVGYMDATTGKHWLTGSPTETLHSETRRNVHVRFTGAHLLVAVDGVDVIDADVPVPFTPDTYYFGFTGAAGGETDYHLISDFELMVGDPVTCF